MAIEKSSRLPLTVNIMAAPFDGIVTHPLGDQWILHPQVQYHLNQEEIERPYRRICAHDLAHSIRASDNGLVLLDMFQANDQTRHVASKIDSRDVAFVLHTHDLGYGADSAQFVDIPTGVVNHEATSWEFVQRQARNLSLFHPSRRYVARHREILQAGILGTAKQYTTVIDEATQHLTSESLFQLLISAADKADYFFRQRVDHLPPPVDMTNPYHPLAYAVNQYQLRFDEQERTLTYTVSFHDNTLFHPDTIGSWENNVRRNCPKVFGLLEAAATIAGCKFVVEVK